MVHEIDLPWFNTPKYLLVCFAKSSSIKPLVTVNFERESSDNNLDKL